MKAMNRWKQASFTVEASVIVPMIVIITALLIGLCFYLHQINWAKGAAYEAALKGVERVRKDDSAEETAGIRIEERLQELPVLPNSISSDVKGRNRVGIVCQGDVLDKVFHGLFRFQTDSSVVHFEPVKIKRAYYLLELIAGENHEN